MYDLWLKDYILVSASGDGKILFWSLANRLQYPLEGYLLIDEAVARKRRGRGGPAVAGCTSLSFSKEGKLSSAFVSGTEGGGLYRSIKKQSRAAVGGGGAGSGAGSSSTETTERPPGAELPWISEAAEMLRRVDQAQKQHVIKLVERHARERHDKAVSLETVFAAKPDQTQLFRNAASFPFARHVGPVYAVEFSPFHRNLFLSCGADGRLCLYSQLLKAPLLHLEPCATESYLHTAVWSATRPLVLAAAGSDGVVYIYDLLKNASAPEAVLLQDGHAAMGHAAVSGDVRTTTDGMSVFGVAFNPKQRNFITYGDASGKVHVWQLGWRLSNPQPSEEARLRRYDFTPLRCTYARRGSLESCCVL